MIQLEVWGPYALFSRPELKVERVSYDVPTPSAARGIVEALYFHPGLQWHIDRIFVLNPIQFTSIRRNEVSAKVSARNMPSGQHRETAASRYICRHQEIVQRASLLLRTSITIEAHFDMIARAPLQTIPASFRILSPPYGASDSVSHTLFRLP